MVKTKIVETTEKYDKDGKLVEKITREENTEDNTDYSFRKKDNIYDEELKRNVAKACFNMERNGFCF